MGLRSMLGDASQSNSINNDPAVNPDNNNGTPPADDPKGDDPKGDDPKGDDPKGDDPDGGGGPAKLNGEEPIGDETEFTIPEGFEFDEEAMTSFKGLAKDLGLDKKGAQKILDLHTNSVSKMMEAVQESETKLKEDTIKQWGKDLRADKEFGGLKYSETVERANRTLRKFTGDARMGEDGKVLLELFSSGTSNHPAMFKFLALIDEATSEHKPAPRGNPASNPVDRKGPTETFYNK